MASRFFQASVMQPFGPGPLAVQGARCRAPVSGGAFWRQILVQLGGLVLCVGGASAQERVQADPRWLPPAPQPNLEAAAAAYLPSWRRVEGPFETLLVPGTSALEPVVLPGGVCYAVVAHGGAVDVDVHVWDGDALVAQDVQPDPWPVARWCATEDGPVRVQLDAWDAETAVRWGIWADPLDLDAALGEMSELENRLASWMAQAAPRWQIVGATQHIEMLRPDVASLVVTPGQRTCDAWLAVGSVGVHDVDMRLMELDGRVLDTDVSADPRAMVQQCGAEGPLRLQVAMPLGMGSIAILQLRRAR